MTRNEITQIGWYNPGSRRFCYTDEMEARPDNHTGYTIPVYACPEASAVRYEYKSTFPVLPPDAQSPVMDDRQTEDWLNGMDADGWEFVGHAQKKWKGADESFIQYWWIFRRPRKQGGTK